MDSPIVIVHEGRGGYIEIDGYHYCIEHIGDGRFCIHFPSQNRHSKLQQHLDAMTHLALSQDPTWYVENRTKRYRPSNEIAGSEY